MAEQLHIAIIGAGPSGYYAAETLVKSHDHVQVDILDRLPTPFGLIRGGVAPDHQSIKGVTRRYEKTSQQDNVRFIGNIEIGSHVQLNELNDFYDAIILATGAPKDRTLNVKGADKKGVIGSAAFVGWYNAHPDFATLEVDLNVEHVVVIGNGNVAVDVARVLAKTAEEMKQSDLAGHAADSIHPAPIKHIWMLGRRGPIEGKFTQKELGELGELEKAVAIVNPDQIPDEIGDVPEKEASLKKKNLSHLQRFKDNNEGDKPVTLHLEFYANPIEILGEDRVEGIRIERTIVKDGKCIGTGSFFEIPCELIVPCIGYQSEAIPNVPFDDDAGHYQHIEGKINDHTYVVGWAKRGPTGTIGTNRIDAANVVETLLEDVKPSGKSGGDGLRKLLAEQGNKTVTFRDWKKIEAEEENRADNQSPRKKFTHIEEMITVVQNTKDKQ